MKWSVHLLYNVYPVLYFCAKPLGNALVVLYVQEVERQYKQQVADGGASDEVKFSYAVYLIKSGFKNDIRKGIRLMESELPRQTMSNKLSLCQSHTVAVNLRSLHRE